MTMTMAANNKNSRSSSIFCYYRHQQPLLCLSILQIMSSFISVMGFTLLFCLTIGITTTTTTTTTTAFPISSTFNVPIPANLYKHNVSGYIHHIGHFGLPNNKNHIIPAYGNMMGIRVYYTDESLCKYPVDKTKGYPHREIDKNSGIMKEWEPPYILMVHRDGLCTFATKTRHAQMAGASGLIIANNRCLCSDIECINETKNDNEHDYLPCEPIMPIVASDGSASDITIPAILLTKPDSDAMIKEMKATTQVIIDMKFRPKPPITDKTSSIGYGFFMDPVDPFTKGMIQNFQYMALAIGNRGEFFPQYLLIDGIKANCHGNDGPNQSCSNMCTNIGRYCYPTYDNIDGKFIVIEILRRLCIWKHHGSQAKVDANSDFGGPEVWWDYVTYFDEHCSASNETYHQIDCIQNAYDYAKIDKTDIETCMVDTGDYNKDDINTMLDHQLAAANDFGVIHTPTIWVNNEHISDWQYDHDNRAYTSSSSNNNNAAIADITASVPITILENICEGFDATTAAMPDVCLHCIGSGSTSTSGSSSTTTDLVVANNIVTGVIDCVKGYVPKSHNKDFSNGSDKNKKKKRRYGWVWLFVLSAMVGVGYVVYKTKFQDQENSISEGIANLRYSLLSGTADEPIE